MRKKYLLLLLVVPLAIALAGCGRRRQYVAPPPEIEAPTNLTAIMVSYKQINLSWQDNSTIEHGFRVCCDMGRGDYQTVITLGPNYTSYEHHFLQPMTEYRYYVQAYRGNEYASSNETSAITSCPVIIMRGELFRRSADYVEVVMQLLNGATEPCQAEITADFYNKDTEELVGTKKDTIYIAALETAYLTIGYTEPEGVDCNCTRKVTDVEIYY